jgi:prepilin peptidase CpaA
MSVYLDTKTRKIKNFVTYPAILAGFATNLILAGFEGLKDSITATILPILILFLFYVLKMLGAGDLKLFGAIGSIMGLNFVLCNLAYAFISGGVIAIILIGIRKNAFERFKYLFNYLKSCFLMLKLEKYQEFDSNNGLFRFSYAILWGTLITVLDGVFTHILIEIR